MDPVVIGVLALQGAFGKHVQMLHSLGIKAVELRKPRELVGCDGLIIPGGESTTMMKQMAFIDFSDAFREFAAKKPVFGTCAGIILMSHKIISDNMQPFNLLDITVERNAFGRQVESFHTDLDVVLATSGKSQEIPAVFIRAPRIRSIAADVNVLASYEGEPVLVQQGRHLGATFHPELSDHTAIHAFFIEKVKAEKRK